MATTRVHGRALRRRKIIERPRLFALLDGSDARVWALVAPAGYGKTTLADQWVTRDGRVGAWLRARPSSTDVAALALGIARVSAAIVPDCEMRLREHLRALPAPAENVEVLAEILGEDLAGWPSRAWLVIDEYDHIASAGDAERFVEVLIGIAPIQVVVTSRARPSWATNRSVVYGHVSEIGQAELAMSEQEAEEVLAERSKLSTSTLVALAEGWPAVIGLASVSEVDVEDIDLVPESLYRFFAEEVFEALGADVRSGLATLAVAPILDRVLARELLGPNLIDPVCTSALDVGVMVERAGQLELHPLAKSFLEERPAQPGGAAARDIALRCWAHYRERRDWEAAFDLIGRHGPPEYVEDLLRDALDELLETGRLSTVESWCAFALQAGVDRHTVALARAEVALRRGRFTEAHTHAEAAAKDTSLEFRALTLAGRAAHLDSREEEALELYARAALVARDDRDSREALRGQLLSLIDMEDPAADEMLRHLTSTMIRSDPIDVVQCAVLRTAYQFRLGSLDLSDADRAHELLDAVRDPVVRASFECIYGGALALSARYDDAQEVAESLIALARN